MYLPFQVIGYSMSNSLKQNIFTLRSHIYSVFATTISQKKTQQFANLSQTLASLLPFLLLNCIAISWLPLVTGAKNVSQYCENVYCGIVTPTDAQQIQDSIKICMLCCRSLRWLVFPDLYGTFWDPGPTDVHIAVHNVAQEQAPM